MNTFYYRSIVGFHNYQIFPEKINKAGYVEISKEEYLAHYQQPLINERNELLRNSDKYILPDFPITPECRGELVAWRAELYAMEKDNNFKENGIFDFVPRPQIIRTDIL
jgi:hypothetical protein